jgi:hypothetical protein
VFSREGVVAGYNVRNVSQGGFVKKSITVYLFLFVFILTACSMPVQPPAALTPSVAATVGPVLMATITPTYLGPLPTKMVDAVASLLPEGQPSAEWKGIPIMPNASAGEGDEEGYVFTVKATTQQVQDFYQAELGKLGWQPFGTGNRDASLVLMFTNSESATLTISIIAKGEEALVLLVK